MVRFPSGAPRTPLPLCDNTAWGAAAGNGDISADEFKEAMKVQRREAAAARAKRLKEGKDDKPVKSIRITDEQRLDVERSLAAAVLRAAVGIPRRARC